MSGYHRRIYLAMLMGACVAFGGSEAAGQSLSMLSAKKAVTGVLSTEGGRFVFGQISDSEKDQFMLDTHTGRLWRVGHSGKVGIFLKPVPYQCESGQYRVLPGEAGAQEAPEKRR